MEITDYKSLKKNQSYVVTKHSNDGIYRIGDIINKGPEGHVFWMRKFDDGWIDEHEFIRHLDGLEVQIQKLEKVWKKENNL